MKLLQKYFTRFQLCSEAIKLPAPDTEQQSRKQSNSTHLKTSVILRLQETE